MRTRSGARRARTLVALAAFAAVLPRGADAAVPAPALTGRVTLSGRAAGYVPVTLARAVDFRANGASEMLKPSATFAGGAYGWLLVTDFGGERAGFAGATKVPRALGGSVVFRIDGRDTRTGKHLFETGVLPAGTYRLYLLTDGSGSVTFRLPGLAGASSRAVATRVAVTATTLGVPTVAGVGPPAHANGVTVTSAAHSLVLSYHYVRTTAQAVAHYGWCHYAGAPPGGTWAPGCPGATSVTLIGAYAPAFGCCGIGTGGGAFGPGTWSYGRFYDTAGVVEQAADLYVVLPLS